MNKYLKKIFIVAVAVCCALSVQLSVGAYPKPDLNDIQGWISNMFTTTNPNEDNTTTTDPNETTTSGNDDETTTDLVNGSGNGNLTTTTETTTAYTIQYNPVTMPPTAAPTTVAPSEESSLSFEASLSDLFEADSAAVIIQQTPTEPYTIGGLVVPDGNGGDEGLSWQKIALIAAAILFVILLALVVALLMQRSRQNNDGPISDASADGEPSGPVAVEVMTPERIAELLGSAGKSSSAGGYMDMTSEESAAAIKTAALMGQLTHSYSDPLIRKYTDEPVMISPSAAAALDVENATAADILKATDSMLDDITGDEKYASDISGYSVNLDADDDLSASEGAPRICPECGNSVPADDVFCHGCGTYIG